LDFWQDIGGTVTQTINEGGLLGMAFHPEYVNNGFFFVYYTEKSSRTGGKLYTVVRRFKVSDNNPDKANVGATRDEIVLTFEQPFGNHNGGTMLFGPNDGYLYISSGDGGSGGDPGNNAQNRNNLLGKILRIDVTVTDGQPAGYTIPDGNPFRGMSNRAEEILH